MENVRRISLCLLQKNGAYATLWMSKEGEEGLNMEMVLFCLSLRVWVVSTSLGCEMGLVPPIEYKDLCFFKVAAP